MDMPIKVSFCFFEGKMRPIFCGNIEFNARQGDLERLFRKYGKVDRVDLKSGNLACYNIYFGEEYKLFWPEQSGFVRMAARFRVTIIPFGAVGEEDYAQLVLDYNDQMKIPFMKDYVKQATNESIKLRNDMNGEVANQDPRMPVILPKVLGRYYYLLGKTIETEGK
ncbi:putative RNA recognition motif domain, nucleotide-binding alpha-beta plait domain superfamily [Helianthus annuus]|nr:putative RNA recognition motif domain, nucleotide-binding alpha-beta plait domain superfamily [Helianthus annuus]